jgi:hypothetical protein
MRNVRRSHRILHMVNARPVTASDGGIRVSRVTWCRWSVLPPIHDSMKLTRNAVVASLFVCAISVLVGAQEALTEQQVNDAIALSKSGTVPTVQVGTFLGMSKGDFDVFIDGPVARIASAAAAATKQYRPFDASKITRDMMAPVYTVRVRHAKDSHTFASEKHIVLQPKGSKGMDDVIQPTREIGGMATFDHFPEGEFQVIVVTNAAPQSYTVSNKDRAKIQ